jgi:hypothetical protein
MPARGNSRYAHLGSASKGDDGLVANIDAEGAGDAIKAVLNAGDCILISATKGQQAIRVVLMSGDQKDPFYLNSSEEANQFFSNLTTTITKYLT